jgi:hypothetical protein
MNNNNNINLKASSVSHRSVIDIRKLSEHNMEELLKLAFQLDEKAFKESFSKVGIKVDSYDEIFALARLHDTGGDVAGALKDSFGNKRIFSVAKTLANVKSNFNSNYQDKKLNLKWK